MFSQVCVKNSAHRGACMAVGVCVWWGACMAGVCMVGGGMHDSRDGHCSGWYASYLECILVLQILSK